MIKNYAGVNLKAILNAMEHLAMQYINYIEVIKHLSPKNKIKDNIEQANNKYR